MNIKKFISKNIYKIWIIESHPKIHVLKYDQSKLYFGSEWKLGFKGWNVHKHSGWYFVDHGYLEVGSILFM